ncbi:hypothetical protein AKO1_013368 [Acrasis kona]|uniref:Response regulatory domain-containing protein n=1 Tax=Acrasis kona TaxID=1008807 RepID=A0AAW2YYD7_9EUKA
MAETVWERWQHLIDKNTTDTLKRCNIDSDSVEVGFEDFTYLAAEACKCPTALVSLLDTKNKQLMLKAQFGDMLKAYQNIPIRSPEYLFCTQAIVQPTGVFEIADSSEHPTLCDAPCTKICNIGYYASVPIIIQGVRIGALCVLDNTPHRALMTEEQKDVLLKLCEQLTAQIQHRIELNDAVKLNERLIESNMRLSRLAGTISHDIRLPLSSILLNIDAAQQQPTPDDDDFCVNLKDTMKSATKIKQIVDTMLHFVVQENNSTTHAEPKPETINEIEIPNVGHFKKLRFLVADDNQVILKLTSSNLQKRGHDVVTASDGQDCIRILEEHGTSSFDVLLVDQEMPRLNGSDVIIKLRQIEDQGQRLYVISSSGHADASFERFIKGCGADHVLSKPIRINTLLKACESLMRS